jgi:pentose-5-phosphate-3-epimerase
MVPKISFGAPVISACRAEFPDTVFDVKLGVIEPERRIAEFVKAGADILSVHPESTVQLGAVINMIKDGGCSAGVVLNPGTGVSAVEHVLPSCEVRSVVFFGVCPTACRRNFLRDGLSTSYAYPRSHKGALHDRWQS